MNVYVRLYNGLSTDARRGVICAVAQLVVSLVVPVCTWIITNAYGGSMFWPSVVFAIYFIFAACICLSESIYRNSNEYISEGMFVSNLFGVIFIVFITGFSGTLTAMKHPHMLVSYEYDIIIACDLIMALMVIAGMIIGIIKTCQWLKMQHTQIVRFVVTREERKRA